MSSTIKNTTFSLYFVAAALLVVVIAECALAILGKPNQLELVLQALIGGGMFGAGAHQGTSSTVTGSEAAQHAVEASHAMPSRSNTNG